MGSAQTFDAVFQFAKVTKSSLQESARTVLHQVAGFAGFEDEDDLSDDAGQVVNDVETYASGPVIFHPRTPGKSVARGVDVNTEVLCVKTADGLAVVGYRDERLNQAYPNPAEGDVAFVHYGGGFHSMSLTNDGQSSIHVIYAPYDFDSNGTPGKAHSIVIDTTSGNESIQMVHAEGSTVSILADSVITRAGDGSAWTELKSTATGGSYTVIAQKITLKGTCFLGAQAESGLPLLPGPASQPTPSVYFSAI
jgi:hypothetical protein